MSSNTANGFIKTVGYSGAVNTTTTAAVNGSFHAVQILTDCVFSAFAAVGETGALTGLTLPAGLTLFGEITGYTLSSGAVRAYIK